MTTYVIKDSQNNVLRIQEGDSPPFVRSGESFSTTNLVFPGWPTETGKKLRFIAGTYQIVDTRNVEQLKAAKNEEINNARLASNFSTFEFAGKTIACATLDRSDIDAVNGYVALTGHFPPGFPNAWKAVDNTYVSIPDKSTWISFYSAMVSRGIDNFNYAQSLKNELSNVNSTTEVDAIVWSR